MNGRHVGTWRQTRGEHDQFIYAKSWLDDPQFRSLSLSLPVTSTREIRAPEVRSYFDNLLPDSERIRERLRAKHGARSVETFDLLEAIGRDCVGAVQLMPEGQSPIGWDRITSTPLKSRDVETLLRAVPTAQIPLLAGAERDDEFRISIEDRATEGWERLAPAHRSDADDAYFEAAARNRRRRPSA
jgi:serine/threonine-protein kinase HipA